jgi:hypothetical protein
MGEQRPKSRAYYGKLSREVETQLSSVHMGKVWDILHDKFCFNSREWKKEFYEFLQKQPGNTSEGEAFIEFGVKSIQPLLNLVLKRNAYHPTWKNLIDYVVKKH